MKPTTKTIAMKLSALALAISVLGVAGVGCAPKQDYSDTGELKKSESAPKAPAADGIGAPTQHAAVAVVQRKPHP